MRDRESERIVERIEKLLRLATSDNAHEAAAALAQAQRLMERHAISEAQLGRARGERPHVEHEPLLVRDASAPCEWWREVLAAQLGKACGCYAFNLEEGGRHEIRLVGCDSDVAAARALFTWCLAEVERIGLSAGPQSTIPYRRGLVLGAVEQVMREIELERRRTHEELMRMAEGLRVVLEVALDLPSSRTRSSR